MNDRDLEAMKRALAEDPASPGRAQVYADALEEAGHPLAPYARGRATCHESDLPEPLARELLGGRLGLTELLEFEDGLLRGVRFLSHQSPLEVRARALNVPLSRPDLPGWEPHESELEYHQRGEAVVAMIAQLARGTLTHVSGLAADTFRSLCAVDIRLRSAALVGVVYSEPPYWDDEPSEWLPGWSPPPTPSPPSRLRLEELWVEHPIWSPALRSLCSGCRPVFDQLERVRLPQSAGWLGVGLLRAADARPLRLVDAGAWRASRDAAGWHLHLSDLAPRSLYEDMDSWDLAEMERTIAQLAPLMTDVFLQGPRMPPGELARYVAAAGGKPIHFDLGSPAEEEERARRGLDLRRFEGEVPLRSSEPPPF